jgi:hypothetical protein
MCMKYISYEYEVGGASQSYPTAYTSEKPSESPIITEPAL